MTNEGGRMKRGGQVPLAVCLFLMVLVLAGCAKGPTHVSRYDFPDDPGRTLVHIESLAPDSLTTVHAMGDVRDVIAGKVPEAAQQWHRAADWRVGFGAGTPTGIRGLGEFMALNGVAYAKNTDRGDPAYYETVSGARFQTTAAVFLPRDANPNMRITHIGYDDRPTTMAQLYRVIHEGTGGRPFVLAGMIEFDRCETLAVSRPPIFGEPLFENRERYYERGPEAREGARAVVMGIVADAESETDGSLHTDLERILYFNPYDESGELVSHAHALILDEEISDWRRVRPWQVRDVNHLLSQSTIRRVWLDVYVVGGVE